MLSSYKYMFGLGLYQLYKKNSHLLHKKKKPIHIIGNCRQYIIYTNEYTKVNKQFR